MCPSDHVKDATAIQANVSTPKSKKRPLDTPHDGSKAAKRKQVLEKERQQLPAWSAKEKLIELLQQHPTVVLVGETGSGKTTQLPRFVFEAGLARGGMIACTQPRRVAAIAVARRVSEEMGVTLGHKVGYQVRFDDCSSSATRIKYMTDGMLLREALLDNQLRRYKVVVVDEAHERTVSTDVLLGLLKQIQARRAASQCPLKLLIMSATIEVEKFVNFFPGAVAGYIQGRRYPVQVYYTPEPEPSYMESAMLAAVQIHQEQGPGDILMFLTGQEEIQAMERLLNDRLTVLGKQQANSGDAANHIQGHKVLPIYAALPYHRQMQVFEPAPKAVRKIILATNIAETSITIKGVRFVIDTGVVKARSYSAKLGVDSLQVVPVSQAQARQRSGRAGREAPGCAYRLYTEDTFQKLQQATAPEIQRVNLGGVVLQLLALGVHDVLGFPLMDPPPHLALLRALELLCALGAVGADGRLTPLGTKMGRLPVEPMFGRFILAACESGCGLEALKITAMVSTDAAFVVHNRNGNEEGDGNHNSHPAQRFNSKHGDHITLLNMLSEFVAVPANERKTWCKQCGVQYRALNKAHDIYQQLHRQVQQAGLQLQSCGPDVTPLLKAMVQGLFSHAAVRTSEGMYKVVATGQLVHIHPSSVLLGKKKQCVLFTEAVHTSKRYARQVSAVEPVWLTELVPTFFGRQQQQQ